jgi:DNA helicase INO80
MQIIERSLPKKQIVKKEHSEIAKEDLASFMKRWQIIARNIPKHHRNFAALLKKRQMDAKRFSENCQREVLHLSIVALQHCIISLCSSLHSC